MQQQYQDTVVTASPHTVTRFSVPSRRTSSCHSHLTRLSRAGNIIFSCVKVLDVVCVSDSQASAQWQSSLDISKRLRCSILNDAGKQVCLQVQGWHAVLRMRMLECRLYQRPY